MGTTSLLPANLLIEQAVIHSTRSALCGGRLLCTASYIQTCPADALLLVKGTTKALTANLFIEQDVIRSYAQRPMQRRLLQRGHMWAQLAKRVRKYGVESWQHIAQWADKCFVMRSMRLPLKEKRRRNKSFAIKGVWGVIFGFEA